MKPTITFSLCVLALSQNAQGELRYDIKPEQVVPYKVQVTVQQPDSTVTMSGVVTITGKSASANTLTLLYQGGLNKSEKQTSRRGFGPPRFGGPPRMRSPFSQPDFAGLFTNTKSTVVISRDGQVTSMKGNSQLPYLLGNVSLFFFERLPEGEQTSWKDGSGISITSRSSTAPFGPRFGPFAGNDRETVTGGGESIDYSVLEAGSKQVKIKRTYSLTSPPADGKDKAYSMSGDGTWVFNRKLGVSESAEYKLTLEVTTNNQTTNMPVSIDWHRMKADEYAAHKEAMAKRQAELKERTAKQAAARKAAGPKPIDSFRKTNITRQLNHRIWSAVWGQLESLNRIGPTPAVKEDMDIVMQVGILRGHSHEKVRTSAEKVWAKWKDRFEELGSDEQKAAVAAAVGESTDEQMDVNPFVVEEESADEKGMRTWSARNGKFKMEAEFVRLDGPSVVLKDEKGRTIRVPKTSLSENDQGVVDRLNKNK